MMQRFNYLSSFCTALFLLGHSCFAASSNLEKIKTLYEGGKYEEALAIAQEDLKQTPDDLDLNFYLGKIHSALNNPEASFMAFERMIIKEPDLTRAKLEMAKTCYDLQLYDLSEQYFEEVLKMPLPQAVEDNVRLFLGNIDESRKHHYLSSKLTLSVTSDSNVGAAPNDLIYLPNGLPVQIADEKGCSFSQALDIRHEYRYFLQAPHVWASDLGLYNNNYDTKLPSGVDEQNIDMQYVRFRTGPRFSYGDFSWEMKMQNSYMYSGNEDYMSGIGLNLGASQRLTKTLWLASNVLVEERKFYENSDQDGTALNWSLTPTWIKGKGMLSSGIGVETHHADESYESYNRWYWGTYYVYQLPWQTNLNFGYRLDLLKNDDQNPVFNEVRDDRQHQASVGISKIVWRNTLLEVQYKHTENYSSLDSYVYDRDLITLSLTYNF